MWGGTGKKRDFGGEIGLNHTGSMVCWHSEWPEHASCMNVDIHHVCCENISHLYFDTGDEMMEPIADRILSCLYSKFKKYKFDSDWYFNFFVPFWIVKIKDFWIICQIYSFYLKHSQQGPGTAREKFYAFFVKQSFFSSDLFRFSSLGYPGVRGLGWHGHTCVLNLPRVGVKVWTVYTRKRHTGT